MSRELFDDPASLIRAVYGYVAYRIGSGPDAEDITSETVERALRYQASFDKAHGSIEAWLIGIARRCIADRALRPSVDVDPRAVDPAEDPADSFRIVELRDAIAVLGERDREIVALRFGADMTVKQIATILEMRTNTVEVALHRALARLRAELGEAEPQESPRLAPASDAAT